MSEPIENTPAFVPAELAKRADMMLSAEVVYKVIEKWCEKHGLPLSSSVHAPTGGADGAPEESPGPIADEAPEKFTSTVLDPKLLEIWRRKLAHDTEMSQTESSDVKSGVADTTGIGDTDNTMAAASAAALADGPAAAPADAPAVAPAAVSTAPADVPAATPIDGPATVPAAVSRSDGAVGLSSPDTFMAQWRTLRAQRIGTAWPESKRQIIIRGLPNEATMSDVFCLVHGGAVERAWTEVPGEMGEVTVQFCKEIDCQNYFNKYSQGIHVSNGLYDADITIEMTDVLTHEKEGSRVIRVLNVPRRVSLDAIDKIIHMNVPEIDHLEYRRSTEKPGTLWIFFCGIVDAENFMHRLAVEDGWGGCIATKAQDPCEFSQGFHTNSLYNGMVNSVANEV